MLTWIALCFCTVATQWMIHALLVRSRTQKKYVKIAEQYGCLPPPLLENQRFLGIDRLEQIFRADKESRFMEFLLFHLRQTGNTLRQRFLMTDAYGTIDPANLEAILSSKFRDWSTGPRRAITFPMFGDGIFTQEGPAWKASRQVLRPQFHFKQYEDLQVFEASMGDLLTAIEDNRDASGVIDLQPLFFRFTLDTTTAFLFGESVRSLKALNTVGEQTFSSAFNTAQEYIVKRFRLLDLYWLIGGRKFHQACRKVHDFADKIIDKNLSRDRAMGTEGRYVFLDSIAESTTNRVALRGQIINILVAGRDTTACLLSWTFFSLIRYPQALQKLKAEIAATVGGDDQIPIHRKDLMNMKYLQNVLKETLRLYPSVPVNTRTSVCDTVLPTGGGPDGTTPILIPKGTTVAFSVYSLHRRPDLYGMDAELFRPERWDKSLPMDKDPTLSSWGYLPFHGGPRICLGMDFALTEAAYAVVRILQHYPELRLPSKEKVVLTGVERQTMTLVISSTEGCRVQLNE